MVPARLLPLVLALGGAGVVVRNGGEVATRIVDTVKVVFVRSELSQIARLIEADAVLGQRPPKSPEALANYLRESMRSAAGRDASLDLWQTPYGLTRQGQTRVVRSLGPNKQVDACATGRAEGAAAQQAVAQALAEGGADAGAGPVVRDDDLCVELSLPTGGRGDGVDPMLGRDSPFRQIRSD